MPILSDWHCWAVKISILQSNNFKGKFKTNKSEWLEIGLNKENGSISTVHVSNNWWWDSFSSLFLLSILQPVALLPEQIWRAWRWNQMYSVTKTGGETENTQNKNAKLFQWIYLQFFLCNCELQMEICNGGVAGGQQQQRCIDERFERRLHLVFYELLCWLNLKLILMLGFKSGPNPYNTSQPASTQRHEWKCKHTENGEKEKHKCESIQPKRQNQLQTIHVITVPNRRVHCQWTNKYLWPTCNFGFMFNYKSSGFKAERVFAVEKLW